MVIPQGIKRFFVSQAEAGAICVLSGILAEHRNILVPSSNAKLELIAFEDIVEAYLKELGYAPDFVEEKDAPEGVVAEGTTWPVIVSKVDTTGEKPFEEFVADDDILGDSPFRDLSVILKDSVQPSLSLEEFEARLMRLVRGEGADKAEYVRLLADTGVAMSYSDMGKYLDDKI